MPRIGRIVVVAAVLAVVAPSGAHAAECTTTVSSTSAAASAVSAAAPGATVCLADGRYGTLSLNASKAAPGVTVRAEHPGEATIAGATLSGSHLTVAQFRMTGTFDARPGSTGMTADHNLFVGGGYYAVMAAATTTTTVNDVAITNNRFVGRFDEDAIRLNRYHDGPDADPYGVLIEGNEFTGNVEYGGHNDVVQSVWVGDHLYFRRNYLHDFGGQGFFVKDQATAIDGLVVEDNLIVRQSSPCDPVSLCPTWQLSPFQIFGPLRNVSIRHNTVWPGPGGGAQWLRGSGWAGPTAFADNVMDNLNSDASGLTTAYMGANNSRCAGSGFPAMGVVTDCSPAFVDPSNGDYRQANGRGVTWRVADQHYGPGAESSPPPSAGDTTAPQPPGGSDDAPAPGPAADEDADAAPTVELTSPAAGRLSGRELKLAARAGDDHGIQRIEFWVDRARVARDARPPYAARYDARGLRAGSHKVTVRAYDTAGQVATDSVTLRVNARARAHRAPSSRSRSA